MECKEDGCDREVEVTVEKDGWSYRISVYSLFCGEICCKWRIRYL